MIQTIVDELFMWPDLEDEGQSIGINKSQFYMGHIWHHMAGKRPNLWWFNDTSIVQLSKFFLFPARRLLIPSVMCSFQEGSSTNHEELEVSKTTSSRFTLVLHAASVGILVILTGLLTGRKGRDRRDLSCCQRIWWSNPRYMLVKGWDLSFKVRGATGGFCKVCSWPNHHYQAAHEGNWL